MNINITIALICPEVLSEPDRDFWERIDKITGVSIGNGLDEAISLLLGDQLQMYLPQDTQIIDSEIHEFWIGRYYSLASIWYWDTNPSATVDVIGGIGPIQLYPGEYDELSPVNTGDCKSKFSITTHGQVDPIYLITPHTPNNIKYSIVPILPETLEIINYAPIGFQIQIYDESKKTNFLMWRNCLSIDVLFSDNVNSDSMKQTQSVAFSSKYSSNELLTTEEITWYPSQIDKVSFRIFLKNTVGENNLLLVSEPISIPIKFRATYEPDYTKSDFTYQYEIGFSNVTDPPKIYFLTDLSRYELDATAASENSVCPKQEMKLVINGDEKKCYKSF